MPALRPALALLACSVALVGCGDKGTTLGQPIGADELPSTTAAPGATSSSSAPAGAGSPTTTAPSAAPQGAATGVAGASTPATTPASNATDAAAIVKPGTYRFTSKVTVDGKTSTQATQTVVTALAEPGSQRWVSTTDGEPSGDRTVAFTADRFEERTSSVRLPEGAQTCTWSPALVQFRRALTADTGGTDTATCPIDSTSLKGTITVSREWHVGARSTKTIAGVAHPVVTYAVVSLRQVKGTAGGAPVDSTVQERRVDTIALDLGIVVASHVDASSAGEPSSSTDTELVSGP